jgi:chorismate synthase
VKILSGTERGHTLGTPVALMVENLNVRPSELHSCLRPSPHTFVRLCALVPRLPRVRPRELTRRPLTHLPCGTEDYAEMSKVPRPGHADYTYQVKYGVRATSGGGRSSARETIGRVAAGAVAEKWMREQYGTEIVSFVASIGDVELPVEGRQRADGSPWSRKDVDTLGTIRILRDPSIWHQITAAEEPDEEKRKAAQTEIDAKEEAAFVAGALLEKGASNIQPGGAIPALSPCVSATRVSS